MTDWIKNFVESSSYTGIALLMLLENVFPPIPSELIMPLAGFVSTRGELTMIGVITAGVIGTVLGAILLYYIGRGVGEERLRRWADRHGYWIGFTGEDIDRSKEWFSRHGGKTVLFCRVVPGIRSLISIPAGLAKMNLGVFLAYTTVGSTVWTAALAYAGRALGSQYERVEKLIGPIGTGVIVAIVLAWAFRVVRHHRRARGRA